MGAAGGLGERVISEQAAQYLTYMMSRVIEDGTGTRARIPGGSGGRAKARQTQAGP